MRQKDKSEGIRPRNEHEPKPATALPSFLEPLLPLFRRYRHARLRPLLKPESNVAVLDLLPDLVI